MRKLRCDLAICFHESLENWHQITDRLDRFFILLEQYGLSENLHYWGRYKLHRKIRSSLPDILSQLKKSPPESFELGDIRNVEIEEDLSLGIDFFSDRQLSIRLIINEKYFTPNLLENMIGFILDLYRDYSQEADLGPTKISLEGVPFQRIRPARVMSSFLDDGIIDFYDHIYYNRRAEERQKEDEGYTVYLGDTLVDPTSSDYLSGFNGDIDKIRTADLPAPWSRSNEGSLTIIRYLDDLSASDAEIAEMFTKRLKWLYENLRPGIDDHWNELGDNREDYFNLQTHSLLTFYNDYLKKGFKSMVINPDGSIDEELFSSIKSWISNHRLPDNTPLETMDIIMPNRDSVLQIYERAKSIGVAKVLYPDNKRRLWNPFPEGEWLDLFIK